MFTDNFTNFYLLYYFIVISQYSHYVRRCLYFFYSFYTYVSDVLKNAAISPLFVRCYPLPPFPFTLLHRLNMEEDLKSLFGLHVT